MSRTASNKKKILLVEDEPVIGRLVTRILTTEGFDVDMVQDGRVAIKEVNKKKYDLCVSDIRLPGITGIQLYERLKIKHPALARRTIFITGDTMNASVQLFLQDSGKPYLVKPFNPEELVEKIRDLLK